MPFNSEIANEMSLLTEFSLDSSQAGLKVHNDASADTISAMTRLFNKGLVTQNDGGYLTNLGRDAAEHAHGAIQILASHKVSA
ncbi:MAG: TIGR02647 family protein [Aliivibrio sp.]|uniref:TIGR02647 family protein n=1 Tax=Aliivibrio sp. TaxID=1872443 RepID=UPI001A3E7431|nr:TIGR02647 family protein [Aliivibrio sp.]